MTAVQDHVRRIITSIPQCQPRQDALLSQLEDLVMVGNKMGMYDAADYIQQVVLKAFDTDRKKNT